LKELGLVANDFPAPCNIKTGVKVPRLRVVRKAPKAPKAAKALEQEQTTSQQAEQQSPLEVSGIDGRTDGEASQDEDEDAVSETELCASTRPSLLPAKEVEETGVFWDPSDRGFPSIHEVIRAATNAFSVDEAYAEPSVALSCRGKQYKVHAKALFEHCRFPHANFAERYGHADVDLEGWDPVIVQALINTISPAPRTSLPEYDIVFKKTERLSAGACLVDPLEITNGKNIQAHKID
jgi:hypothetical protein